MSRVKDRNPRVSLLVIERMPHRRCLRLKRSCHVVFDHMRGWFGISSLESLSQGKPVIAGLDQWNVEQIRRFTGRQSLPWVPAGNPGELEQRLNELVNDSGKRDAIGRESRAFMEQVWNEGRVLEVLTGAYESL
ncbi:MAG: glycosyltransferase [Deltaproteobacteria bacterium]|nr:glycosyltransferase [Deltaproteobacteria bacterium]